MRLLSLVLALLLSACATARFDPVGQSEASYAAEHPFFAEYCAVSQIKKIRGFGADIRGQMGGHAVFYLGGACRDEAQRYPVLVLCERGGAGLSMNAHFRNAKWVAVPGHEFFFEGGLAQGVPVTPVTYATVQSAAKRLGLYDAVTFHDEVFEDMPSGWSREDWKYEVSIGTDYAIAFARGRYCARVPVTKAQMARMVDFLNAENAPYRAGAVFEWNLFSDNCIHLAHNALAAAGLWAPWPTHRSLLVSMLDFPVPKNEFVNLMRRTNDELPDDPGAAYADEWAKRSLLQFGVLPTGPGALAESRPPRQRNALYETDLKLIFYDDPLLGSYQRRFDRIFSDPRYTDPAANRHHFATAARRILAARAPLASWLQRQPYAADPALFSVVYARYYGLMERLARL